MRDSVTRRAKTARIRAAEEFRNRKTWQEAGSAMPAERAVRDAGNLMLDKLEQMHRFYLDQCGFDLQERRFVAPGRYRSLASDPRLTPDERRTLYVEDLTKAKQI